MAEETLASTDFDPTIQGELYSRFRDSWLLNRDFAEMHLQILRDGDYLDQFGVVSGAKATEAGSQYLWRKNQSFAMDHATDLINLRVDNIFRTLPVREFEGSPHREFIERFIADVDGGGTTMDVFMRRALRQYYVNGVDIVVDKERVEGAQPDNRAQENGLGVRPFIQMFGPLDRVDWSMDHAMNYLWVRYSMGEVASADELSGLTGINQYLTLTRDEWRLYTTSSEDSTQVESGSTSLGVVPVVQFYFKTSDRRELSGIPLSLLTRISPIARYLMNLFSQTQVDIYRSIAFLVATGVDAEKIPTEITPMGCWALPDEAAITEISGDVAHITAKLDFAKLLMETILRMGKLTGGTGDLQSRASSGVQVAVERTDLDNEMRMTAVQAEEVEKEVIRLAISRELGELIDVSQTGYNVEYNKRFVLSSVPDLVQQLRDMVDLDLGDQVPTVHRVLLRKVLDALISKDAEEYDEALKEIGAAEFGIAEPPPEEGGGDAERALSNVLAAGGVGESQ